MKRVFVVLILIVGSSLFALTALAFAAPPPGPLTDPEATAQAAQATADAAQWQARAAQATADAARMQATANAQATVQAARATATAQAYQATATSAAITAEVQATQRALEVQATQQSLNATATTQAYQAAMDATATAEASRATATAVYIATERDRLRAELNRLELEQAKATKPITTYGPWIALVSFLVALVWGTRRIVAVLEKREGQGQSRPAGAAGDTFRDDGASVWSGLVDAWLVKKDRPYRDNGEVIEGELVPVSQKGRLYLSVTGKTAFWQDGARRRLKAPPPVLALPAPAQVGEGKR